MVRQTLIIFAAVILSTMRCAKPSGGFEDTTPYPDMDLWSDTNPEGGASSSPVMHGCDYRNPDFNCSEMDYVRFTLGPQRIKLIVTVPITVLYVVIFITGVVGNVAVCVVIIKNTTMHSATNYYLFSLAVSDLTLLLFGLPNDISYYWHQYPYKLGIGFCKFRALLSEATSYVSILTIVAFSMERYLAICHPLHLYAMSGLKRAVRIIACLWVVSLLAATPFAVHTTIHYRMYPPRSLNATQIPESAFCAMLGQPEGWPLWEMSSIIFFILPAVVIMLLYTRMGLKIRSRHGRKRGQSALNGINGSVHGEVRQAQSRKAIIRMLAAVVIAFFVCWAPFHAQRLLYIYGHNWKHFQNINEWMFIITGWLYYVSSTVNPILYNVMSKRYRVAFKETLCCGRRIGSSNGSGFARDQSSFRETTINESGHLVRVRSVVANRIRRTDSQRYARHSSPPSLSTPHNVKWNDSESLVKLINPPQPDHGLLSICAVDGPVDARLCFDRTRKRPAEKQNGCRAEVTAVKRVDAMKIPMIDISPADGESAVPVVVATHDIHSETGI